MKYVLHLIYVFIGVYNRFLLYNNCHRNWAFYGCKASIFDQQAQIKIPFNHHIHFYIRLCLQFAKILCMGNWTRKMWKIWLWLWFKKKCYLWCGVYHRIWKESGLHMGIYKHCGPNMQPYMYVWFKIAVVMRKGKRV